MGRSIKERSRKVAGGRPRKFSGSSRPITVTLPEQTLALLASVDSDRARAIVKSVDLAVRRGEGKAPSVEVLAIEENSAIIIVGPSRCLKEIPFLRLIEIAPARFLLVIPTGTPVEALEVAVMDNMESLPEGEDYERNLLTELHRCLALQRRRKKVSKAELLLIETSTSGELTD